jgi:small subunit ribosomal protein S14|tara:strand:+ start:120 stop:419 length:300 start_codon:yes stop_codon:yes gene_type:complete
MKSRVLKDKKRRKLVSLHERQRILYKSIAQDLAFSIPVRWKATAKLASLPKDSSRVRVRNRCIMTGRPRGVYRQFRLSRIALREMASMGLMNGISKASW